MDEEKEIEDMEKKIADICPALFEDGCEGVMCARCLAYKLQKADYGNIKQAVKESAEKLKADLNNAYVNATTPFQAGKNAGLDIALILIDELISELYKESE